MAVRFSIGSQASSPNSEAITASNIKNIKFEIKNNKLDQLQGIWKINLENKIFLQRNTTYNKCRLFKNRVVKFWLFCELSLTQYLITITVNIIKKGN